MKAFRESKDFSVFDSVDEHLCSRNEFVGRAMARAVPTFALVKDGKWYEKGEMGWWACVSNEKEQSDWNKEFNDLLESIPNDTLISVFDCHI